MKMKHFTLYLICFYIAWTIKEVVFGHFWPSATDSVTFAALVVKLLVWIVPVYCYLSFIDHIESPLSYLGLTQNVSQGIKWGLGVGAVVILVEIVVFYVSHTAWHFDIGIRWVFTPLLAFSEEVVFRGFVLQKLSASMKFDKANTIAAVLFVCIHFPTWIDHETTLVKLLGNVVIIFVIGYSLGYLYKRTNSLWANTIVHSIYNLIIYLRLAGAIM